MAGCAIFAQTIINVKSSLRGRLSTFVVGTFLLILQMIFSDYVVIIPMAALVAIVTIVSTSTFSWSSIANLREHPNSSSVVLLATFFVAVLVI